MLQGRVLVNLTWPWMTSLSWLGTEWLLFLLRGHVLLKSSRLSLTTDSVGKLWYPKRCLFLCVDLWCMLMPCCSQGCRLLNQRSSVSQDMCKIVWPDMAELQSPCSWCQFQDYGWTARQRRNSIWHFPRCSCRLSFMALFCNVLTTCIMLKCLCYVLLWHVHKLTSTTLIQTASSCLPQTCAMALRLSLFRVPRRAVFRANAVYTSTNVDSHGDTNQRLG